jgi:hypothetical protein
MTMLVALSVRKLKPGAFDDFRRAWEPDEFPSALQRAFHIRSVSDPDQVISFGFLDGRASDLDAIRAEIKDGEDSRQRAMAPHVEEVTVDGIFEVVDEVVPVA